MICSKCGSVLLSTGVCSNIECSWQATEDKRYYYLMNKDVKIAKFYVRLDIQMAFIESVYTVLPSWLSKNLRQFIESRQPPKHRKNIKELLAVSGCDTLDGYLQITHALSLNDTFWVKQIDSALTWDDVSLYKNPFNDVVARTAFDGGLFGDNFSTTSPEYGTDGSFAKCWIREDGVIKLLKRGSSGAANAGLEPYSEFYASQVVKELISNSVEYSIRTHHGRLCTACNCFTDERYGYLPYGTVDRENTDMLSVIERMESYGLSEEIKDMFVVDAIIFNEDRHKGNFGFIVDNDKQEILGMAPLFDHNISLLCYAMEDDFDSLDKYLEDKGPRLARDFYTSAKVCLTPKMRKKLINMRDFEFTRDSKYNLPEWRLKSLETFVQANIQRILSN